MKKVLALALTAPMLLIGAALPDATVASDQAKVAATPVRDGDEVALFPPVTGG